MSGGGEHGIGSSSGGGSDGGGGDGSVVSGGEGFGGEGRRTQLLEEGAADAVMERLGLADGAKFPGQGAGQGAGQGSRAERRRERAVRRAVQQQQGSGGEEDSWDVRPQGRRGKGKGRKAGAGR